MLKLKMAEKLFQRRESSNKLLRSAATRNHNSAAACTSNIINNLEAAAAIAQFISDRKLQAGGAPPTRMKILVRKEDLKHVMMELAIREIRRPTPPRVTTTLEHRLNLMHRRRQILRPAIQVKGINRAGSWRPVLQSIPEN